MRKVSVVQFSRKGKTIIHGNNSSNLTTTAAEAVASGVNIPEDMRAQVTELRA